MAGMSTVVIRTNVDSGGTPQQISSSYNNVRKVVFKAAYANAALLKIGLSGFSTNYFSLDAGQILTLENVDLSQFYVDGTTSDDLETIILI